MILHHDVEVNYEKLAWDFLHREQHRQQFILKRLFLENAWLVFCSVNATISKASWHASFIVMKQNITEQLYKCVSGNVQSFDSFDYIGARNARVDSKISMFEDLSF